MAEIASALSGFKTIPLLRLDSPRKMHAQYRRNPVAMPTAGRHRSALRRERGASKPPIKPPANEHSSRPTGSDTCTGADAVSRLGVETETFAAPGVFTNW